MGDDGAMRNGNRRVGRLFSDWVVFLVERTRLFSLMKARKWILHLDKKKTFLEGAGTNQKGGGLWASGPKLRR